MTGPGLEPLLFCLAAGKGGAAFVIAVGLGEELGHPTSAGIPRSWIALASAICFVCAVWIRGSSGGGSEIRAGWCRLASWLWVLVASVFGRVAVMEHFGHDPMPLFPLLAVAAPLGALSLYRVGRDAKRPLLRALAASVVVTVAVLPFGMWSPVLILPSVAVALAAVCVAAVLSVAVCSKIPKPA